MPTGRGNQVRVWNGGRGSLGMADGNHTVPCAMDDQCRTVDPRGCFVGQSGKLDHVVLEPLVT